MLLITRSLIAAAVIVGSVVVSHGASFGMSVLIWQHLLGKDLQFTVMAMAVIIFLAVRSDYKRLGGWFWWPQVVRARPASARSLVKT